MLKKISFKVKKILLLLVVSLIICVLSFNIFSFYQEIQTENKNLIHIIDLLLSSLISMLILALITLGTKLKSGFSFAMKSNAKISKLRKRIIIAFSVGAVVPTIIITIFSTYFFNFGIQAWFDKKISKILEQSINVGESYIQEHILRLKETAISLSDILNSMYYDLIHNPELFAKVINNAQAELRSFDEAIVFQKTSNTILAQTSLSFSLAFINIPTHLIERADKGEIVQINAGRTKIRILMKLRDYDDIYLLVGRLIDARIIDHIDNTNGAGWEYNLLKQKIITMQIKFSMVFIFVSLLLIVIAVVWGKNFAEQIVKPIRELVIAAEKVKNGDFTVQVPLTSLKKDEIKVLSSAFNRMVAQIDRQQKDLVIAQRVLAWSDVARRVAHEIKNPLTPIQLSAERLVRKFKDEVSDKIAFEKYIDNILRNSDDIKKIVSEFVEFARLPSLHFSNCEIVSLINDLIESRKLINDDITYSFFSNVKKYDLVCDISQITRVMTNLILNAEESLEHVQRSKKISIFIDVNGKNIEIAVEDNGPGFTPEMLNSAKEAYVTTKSKGTGLGLSIVERIILDHFGEVKITNVADSGAKIQLTMDIASLRAKL